MHQAYISIMLGHLRWTSKLRTSTRSTGIWRLLGALCCPPPRPTLSVRLTISTLSQAGTSSFGDSFPNQQLKMLTSPCGWPGPELEEDRIEVHQIVEGECKGVVESHCWCFASQEVLEPD